MNVLVLSLMCIIPAVGIAYTLMRLMCLSAGLHDDRLGLE